MQPAPEDCFEMATTAHAEGRLDEAITRYEECLRNDPDDAVVLSLLGAVHTAQGRAPEGRILLERSVQLDPENEIAWFQLGVARQRLGDHEGAVEAILQARRLRMPFPETAAPLAASLTTLRRFEQVRGLPEEIGPEDAGWRELQIAATEACLGTGRLDEAETRARDVLSRYESDVAAVSQLITRCLLDPVPLKRVERLRRLQQEMPNSVPVISALAEQSGRFGLLEEAERLWGRIVELDPSSPIGPYQQARILAMVGRLDEAVGSVERSLQIAPDYSDAWLMLSQVKRFREGDPWLRELDRIESKLPELAERDRCNLHFAFAHIQDSIGEYDRAFDHLRLGSAIHRRIQPSDIDTLVEVGRRIIEGASPSRWRNLHHEGIGDGPIFVVGMPRSGTTLTERILSRHPRVRGVGELTLAPELINRVGFARVLEQVRELDGSETPPLILEFARAFIEAVSPLHDADSRICDKQPLNYQLLGPIAVGIPNASIVHCVRDPRDIAMSCYQSYFLEQPWSFDLRDIGRCLRIHHDLMLHWHECLSDRIITLEYERLVTEPETEVRRLLKLLNLDFDERCLTPEADRGAVSTVSFAQVRRRINSGSVGKWRRYERHLKPLLDEISDLLPTDHGSAQSNGRT
jgi:tetratricopeptide (TPR) repeat protein